MTAHAAYFPQDGHFNLDSAGLPPYAVLRVEGPEMRAQGTSTSRQPSLTVTSMPTSAFRSVIPSWRGLTFTLKVVTASMLKYGQGKPVFQPVAQMFVDITETTANVEQVHASISSHWGYDYKLASIDGLQIEDSPATQSMQCTSYLLVFYKLLVSFWFSAGLMFWKNPRHKLYAVSKADLKSGDSKKWALNIEISQQL